MQIGIEIKEGTKDSRTGKEITLGDIVDCWGHFNAKGEFIASRIVAVPRQPELEN